MATFCPFVEPLIRRLSGALSARLGPARHRAPDPDIDGCSDIPCPLVVPFSGADPTSESPKVERRTKALLAGLFACEACPLSQTRRAPGGPAHFG